MEKNNIEVTKNENLQESAPGTIPEAIGTPKKSQFQDLLPVLGKYKIEDIVGNKEAIGMIVQLLLDEAEKKAFCEGKNKELQDEISRKSEGYTKEKTKLEERWKSQLELQVLSFISALALGFAFQFKDKAFVLLLIIGILSGLFSFIMPFIINRKDSKE